MTSAGDDDHDDDAQLRQLRAVWVTMRDEDPPDRGLAALMSAAREKAAELEQAASPSWWQRVLQTLRRPPVLALATVTLLLGGALIVTQRSADMRAESTVESDDNYLTPVAAPGAPDGYGYISKGGEGLVGGAASAGSGATVAQPMEVTAERQKPRDAKAASTAKPTTAKPAAKPPTAKTTGAMRPTDDALGLAESTPDRDPGAPVVAGPRGAGGGAPPVMSIAQDPAPVVADSAAIDEAAGAKPKPKKPIARTAPPSIEGEDRQVTQDTAKQAAPTIDQLVKQCETAASRGDCAAVRVIAQKIQTTAPAAYKSRVASNAAIKRCLPQAAPNAAATE